MPTCPNCGAPVPEGAIACGRCGATLSAQGGQASMGSQSEPYSSPQQRPNSVPYAGRSDNRDLSMRLEKALRRSELLTYVAIGLGLVILVLLFVPPF